jgi:hypothetical protein
MTNERPIHEIKLGRVKVSIWTNCTEAGFRFNVTACRIYKDGDQWKTSESFGRDEIPLICKALDMAHTWILTEGVTYSDASHRSPVIG